MISQYFYPENKKEKKQTSHCVEREYFQPLAKLFQHSFSYSLVPDAYH